MLQQRVAEARAAINQSNVSLAAIAAKDFVPIANVKMTSSVTVSEIERKLREQKVNRESRQDFVMLWLPGFLTGLSFAYLVYVFLTR